MKQAKSSVHRRQAKLGREWTLTADTLLDEDARDDITETKKMDID